jgi:elongation factor P
MLSFSEIKLGKVIIFNDQPYVVTKCDFLKMNRAKPSKKVVLKHVVDGGTIMHTFGSGDNAEEADILKQAATFTYQDGDTLYFMREDNYETVEIPAEMLDDQVGYIKEGLEVKILYFQDAPISVDIPIKLSFEIIETVEVDKGNTVQGVMKDATIETGKVVKVPSFIKKGDKVIINTVENEYSERDTGK